MDKLTGGFRPYLLLTLLCLVLYLPGIAAVPPLDRDESRFVQATRQMLETGDYVRIQFQDEMRAKKPVGAYWLQAASVGLFSDAASTAIWPYRLPSVLAAWASVLMTFGFGRHLIGRNAALLAAALLGSSLMLVMEAHQAKTDAVLLACVVAAQGALARFYASGRATLAASGGSTGSGCSGGGCGSGGCGSGGTALPGGVAAPGIALALVFWLAQGFGILVKGPIVPMVSLLTVLALAIADRRAGWLIQLRPLTGLLVAAAIAAPWFAAISKATGGAFVGEAVKADLLPKLLGAQESHGGFPGYYALLATAFFWPGSLFLWPALAAAWRERATPAIRFCLAWAVPSWLVFELVPTKLPHYVLPCYPALALLTAAAVLAAAKATGGRWMKGWSAAWAVIGLVLAAAVAIGPARLGPGFTATSLPAVAGILLATGLVVTLVWRQRMLNAAGALVLAALAAFPVLFAVVLPGLDRLWLSRDVARIAETVGHDGPVMAAGYSEPSLVFLLGTRTAFGDGAGAASYLQSGKGTMAVVSDREEPAFTAEAERLGLRVRKAGEASGINYSRGRPTALGVWSVER